MTEERLREIEVWWKEGERMAHDPAAEDFAIRDLIRAVRDGGARLEEMGGRLSDAEDKATLAMRRADRLQAKLDAADNLIGNVMIDILSHAHYRISGKPIPDEADTFALFMEWTDALQNRVEIDRHAGISERTKAFNERVSAAVLAGREGS